MRYGTPEMVSYEVQPTSTQEHAKTLLGRHDMSKGNKIHNITGEILSNGVLSH